MTMMPVSNEPLHNAPKIHTLASPPSALLIATLLALAATSCGGDRPGEPRCYAAAALGAYACDDAMMPRHKLPFRPGYTTQVMQGMHGEPSHAEALAYAVDLGCREGDVVAASRAGVVWAVREDSVIGCDEPRCRDEANYVVLDHGDGTFSEYQHLQPMGALVEEGDQVCAGQAIGLCGTTGYTSGPHLHFSVFDSARQTIPTRFVEAEAAQRGWGLAVPGAIYVSGNDRPSTCQAIAPSRLHRLAFAHQGIRLDESVPTMIEASGPRELVLRGSYRGQLTHIAALRQRRGGEAVVECVPVGEDGRFELRVAWPQARFSGGEYLFMVTGANAQCHHTGAAWAYHLNVGGPIIEVDDPRTSPRR